MAEKTGKLAKKLLLALFLISITITLIISGLFTFFAIAAGLFSLNFEAGWRVFILGIALLSGLIVVGGIYLSYKISQKLKQTDEFIFLKHTKIVRVTSEFASVLNKNLVRYRFLFWGGVLLIWLGVIVGILWSKGYQPQNSRSFTDEKMIRIAAKRVMQRMLANPPFAVIIPGKNGVKSDESFRAAFVVPYRDVDHFLAENPKCCTVIRRRGELITVYVDGKIFYRDKSGQIHAKDNKRLGWQHFPDNIRYLP